MTITTRLFSFFNGKLVDADMFGNRYYLEKKPAKGKKARRWVIYNGLAEPSKVPPEWHGWLHYTLDTPPSQRSIARYDWRKPYIPNLTGTTGAYVPPGSLLGKNERAKTTADYEAWTPR